MVVSMLMKDSNLSEPRAHCHHFLFLVLPKFILCPYFSLILRNPVQLVFEDVKTIRAHCCFPTREKQKKTRLLKRKHPNPTSMSDLILLGLTTNTMPWKFRNTQADFLYMKPQKCAALGGQDKTIKLDSCTLANTDYRGLAHFQVADFILLLENNLCGRDFFFFNTRHHLSGIPKLCWIAAILQSVDKKTKCLSPSRWF